MTLQVGLHNITSAKAIAFDGHGCVSFHSNTGTVDLYVAPAAARAIADAFNASVGAVPGEKLEAAE